MKPLITTFTLLTVTIAAYAQPTLTGVMQFAAQSNGSFSGYGNNVWNTKAGDDAVNLYVTRGPSLNSPFLSGPTDSAANISLPLNVGVNGFVFYAPGGGPSAYHAMNLFFDGQEVTPGISVFGVTQTSAQAPSFAANSNPSTLGLAWYTPIAGAGTLTYQSGNYRVTLTSYSWGISPAYNSDRVGIYFGDYGWVGSDGAQDWVGQITLDVAMIPEPGCFALGIVGFAMLALRRASRK